MSGSSLNFLDNDIVLKICQYELENHFFNYCAPLNSIRILPTLKFKFCLNEPAKAIKYAKTEDNLKRLISFVASVSEASTDLENNPYLELFNEVDQIDSGEAVLFALIALHDPSITFTGDKRSIIALSRIENDGLREAINGRIKCLEQTIAELLLKEPENEVLHLINSKHWDSAIRACASANKDDMLQGLNSYYNDLRRHSGDLLAPFPT